VYRLQTCLKFLGFQKVLSNPNAPYFGERTREALLAFQVAHRIDTPSVLAELRGEFCGQQTLSKLHELLDSKP